MHTDISASVPSGGPPVSLPALWFGVLAPPLSWSAHELISYGFASFLCAPREWGGRAAPAHATSLPFMLVTVAALALLLAGSWTAFRNWRRLGRRARDGGRGMGRIGIERSRFLARCGVINSVVFIAAFFFTLAGLVVAPLCG